jgi:hypothetical protein
MRRRASDLDRHRPRPVRVVSGRWRLHCVGPAEFDHAGRHQSTRHVAVRGATKSRHKQRTVPRLHRARYLRRRLARYGVLPELFTPIEPRPLSHRRFWQLALELRAVEDGLVRLREQPWYFTSDHPIRPAGKRAVRKTIAACPLRIGSREFDILVFLVALAAAPWIF